MSEKDNIEKLMDEKGMQFRSFVITRADEKDGSMIVEGTPIVYNEETVLYTSEYGEDRETILDTALDDADMSDVIFNFNHCGRVYARTRNSTLTLTNQSDGLHMSATLMSDDTGHQELYRDIKSGLLDRMSFAFTVQDSEYTLTERQDEPDIYLRTITKIDKLYDVSVVDFPAYDATTISARRAFDAESERRESERAAAESRARAMYNYEKVKGKQNA